MTLQNKIRGTALCLATLVSLAACAASSGGKSDDSGAGEGRRAGEEKEGASVTAEEMSVRDLVGQMFVVSVGGTEPDYYVEKMVRERNVGGVILFGYNMKSEAQVQSLTSSLQQLSMQTEPAVPLFVAVDQEGGDIASAPWVSPQPAAAGVGGRGDPAEARAVARSTSPCRTTPGRPRSPSASPSSSRSQDSR